MNQNEFGWFAPAAFLWATALKLFAVRASRWLLVGALTAFVLTSAHATSETPSTKPSVPTAGSPRETATFTAVTAGSTSQTGSPPTTVALLQNVSNSIQLGVEINGQFSYPFVFTADPQPTGDIKISPAGLITGTPSQMGDQNLLVTIKDSNGKTVAVYPVLLHVVSVVTVMLGSHVDVQKPAAVVSANRPDQMDIVVAPVYEGGDSLRGSVLPSPANDPNTQSSGQSTTSDNSGANGRNRTEAPKVTIECTTKQPANTTTICNSQFPAIVAVDSKTQAFSYQFNTPLKGGDTISVSTGSEPPSKSLVQTAPRLLGEELRAVVGYQQAGASSSDFTQDWFLDFYISRPLAFHDGAHREPKRVSWRWWGNVRVASFPQAGNQSVADLAAGLATQLGAVKLNQLAQGAEFLSGIEYQPWRTFPLRGLSENSRQSFSLGLVAGVGATGFFTSPSHTVQVFQVPAVGSPQFATFQKFYPGVDTANVGFISPDVERFPKQYLAGIRLTTHYVDPTGIPLISAPAMLAFTLGQNEVVSGGRLQGVVGRVEAFYPLPFGNRAQTIAGAFSSLYLFGTAQMRLGSAKDRPSLVLQPVNVPAYDPTVTLIPSASTRDLYDIGFGVDLVSLVSRLTGGATKNAVTSAAAKKSPTPPSPPAPTTANVGSNEQ